jgi:translation initiation factor eIF-2B subunit delta
MIDETAEEIADMQTHSSSVVAVKAARALLEVTDREFPTVDQFIRALDRNSSALKRANPSHASLHTTQQTILDRIQTAEFDSVAAAQKQTETVIREVIEGVETSKRRAANNAADLLSDGETILTHDYSTSVLAALARAIEDGASVTVYVTEARPRFLGRRMARRLADFETVETHLIIDSAHGHYLADCDRVMTGMDCIVDERLYTRIGTYPIASTAADADVPVTTVGSAAKIVEGGFSFENDHRVASEVMREPAEGFQIDNPAYDATPLRLIDSVVTDEGVRTPDASE